MQVFQAGGRDWVLKVDLPKIELVRAKLNFDIGARDCSQFEPLTNDPLKAGNVLWLLVADQAEKVSVSREMFLESLQGDDGETASRKLLEAIIDFFPSRQRDTLRRMLAEHVEAQSRVQAAAAERINLQVSVETLTAEGLKELHQKLDELLGPCPT